MNIQHDYEPRLVDHGGDLTKRWYIDFRIYDTDKGEFVRRRYTGMNKYTSKAKRLAHSKKKLAEVKELLRQGYTSGKKPLHGLPINIDSTVVGVFTNNSFFTNKLLYLLIPATPYSR